MPITRYDVTTACEILVPIPEQMAKDGESLICPLCKHLGIRVTMQHLRQLEDGDFVNLICTSDQTEVILAAHQDQDYAGWLRILMGWKEANVTST